MGDASAPISLRNAGGRVIIIGSGCTGLAIAQGLKRAGIQTIVFEKNATLFDPTTDRDWNMGLHWAVPVLTSLLPPSLSSLLQTTQVDPNTPTKPLDNLSFLHGSTGETLSSPSIPNFHRLRRSKLRALLAQGLDIRYSCRLAHIIYEHDGQTVTAAFTTGQHISARLVIGADGARSAVRRLLLGPDLAAPTRLPYSATFVQSRFSASQALFLRSFHPLYLASPHPDNYFAFFGLQDAPDADKPEEWTFFFYISWNSSLEQQDEERKVFTNADRLRQVKEKAKVYCEPWKSAFEWTREGTPAWYFDLSVWDPSLREHEWDNRSGRCTLVGDAAHPMTYQRGQGLNHSITDAGKLVDLLTTSSLPQAQAIAAYEQEMKSRAGEEVRLSVVNTEMLHDWQRVLNSPVVSKGLKMKVDDEGDVKVNGEVHGQV